MQASDLIGRIAVVMKTCGEEVLMSHLGVVLYEYLGEEYPEVLGSILGALKVSHVHNMLGVFCVLEGQGAVGGGTWCTLLTIPIDGCFTLFLRKNGS